MRRIALASAVVLTAVLVAAPGPKANPVTNPLTADLDGGSHHITNLQSLQASNVISTGAIFSGTHGIAGAIQFADGTHPNGPFITAGTAEPSDAANPGSLYLRWKPDGTGELWLYGPTWTCIGGCP